MGTMNEHELSLLADLLPDAVVVIDETATVCWGNKAAERMMGRSLDDWIGSNGLELLHPDDVGLAMLSITSIQGKEVGAPIEMRIATRTGWVLVELVGTPLGEGRVLMTMRDVTQRRRWELAGDETAKFRSLVQNSSTVMMLVSASGVVTSISGAITRQLAQDPEIVCGRHLACLVDDDDHEALSVALHQARTSTATHPTMLEVLLLDASGGRIPYELTFVSLLDDPTVGGLVVTGHDITRLRAAQADLEQLATYDNLTGLLNRRVFDGVVDREWLLTQNDGVDSYVIVADLDGFKQLNDEYGHAAGDDALREFGVILRSLSRETDVVARLGGDEFGVVQIRCGGEFSALGFEAAVHDEMALRTWPGGLKITASVGHQSLKQASSALDAVGRADHAMFDNKRSR